MHVDEPVDAPLGDLFAALANQDRLALLRALQSQRTSANGTELSISDLATAAGLNRFATSRHLSVLKRVDLVECESVGRRAMHRLNVARFEQIEDWLYPFLAD